MMMKEKCGSNTSEPNENMVQAGVFLYDYSSSHFIGLRLFTFNLSSSYCMNQQLCPSNSRPSPTGRRVNNNMVMMTMTMVWYGRGMR